MVRPAIFSALLFAAIAAVGNAMYAFGQRKSVAVEHPFIFLIATLAVCFVLFLVTSLVLPKPEVSLFLKDNYRWVLMSGSGFYLTSLGFYFLYSRHGASHYVIYAVLSIVTTSIIVGGIVLRESLNFYHFLAVATAILTVILFSLGQAKI